MFLAVLGLNRYYQRPKKYRPEQEWHGRNKSEDARRAFLTMDTSVSAYEMTWMAKDEVVK